jgi:hypothetical protein
VDLYLADIDGVAISLAGVPHEAVISQLCNRAEKNWLGLVTGREAAYLAEHFLPALEQTMTSRPEVERRVLVGVEYAGMLLSHHNGAWQEEVVVAETALPHLRMAAQQIAQRYPLLMFHERKRIVITVGIPSQKISPEELVAANAELEQAAEELTSLVHQSSGIELQRTTKAVDIVPAGMNKAFGATIMLKRCGFVPQHTHIFGDAPADLALAEPFIERSLPYTFWYVGRQADLSANDRRRLMLQFPSADALFEEGTLEILNQIAQV